MSIEKQKLVAFVSGEGTTLEEVAGAMLDGRLPRTELAGVIASTFRCRGYFKGFEFADSRRVRVVKPSDYFCEDAFGEALISRVKGMDPDVCGFYGYYPKVPGNFLDFFKDKLLINQHCGPINPDDFDFGGSGMGSPERVHAARLMFARKTGRNFWTDMTAQRIAHDIDKGNVLKRGRVEILPDDTVASLKQRAIREEWRVNIEVLKDAEEHRVQELPPYDDLVLKSERKLLAAVKEMAKYLYPIKHG